MGDWIVRAPRIACERRDDKERERDTTDARSGSHGPHGSRSLAHFFPFHSIPTTGHPSVPEAPAPALQSWLEMSAGEPSHVGRTSSISECAWIERQLPDALENVHGECHSRAAKLALTKEAIALSTVDL